MWYAVQVVTGREEATLAQLMRACEQAGLSGEIEEAFVPKRVVFEGQLAHARRVERALFPGYLILVTLRGRGCLEGGSRSPVDPRLREGARL